MKYNVLFVWREARGEEQMVVTWRTWPTKPDFDLWFNSFRRLVILEEGISYERCKELSVLTSRDRRIEVAFEDAIDSNGRVNGFVLGSNLVALLYVQNH